MKSYIELRDTPWMYCKILEPQTIGRNLGTVSFSEGMKKRFTQKGLVLVVLEGFLCIVFRAWNHEEGNVAIHHLCVVNFIKAELARFQISGN